jgi:hypothetical protein
MINRLNEDVYNQLVGSINYILSTSEKYQIPLPNKDEILAMLERTNIMIEDIHKSTHRMMDVSDQPTLNTKNDQSNNEQSLFAVRNCIYSKAGLPNFKKLQFLPNFVR